MKLDLNDLEGVCFLTDYADAERCLAIYSNPLAVERPEAAWLVLPFGLGVKASLIRLAHLDTEPDAPAGTYTHNLGMLRYRRDAALAAWHAYTNKGVSAHVH